MKKIIIFILLLVSISNAKIFNLSVFESKIIGKNIKMLSKELSTSPHIKKMALKKITINKASTDIVASVALSIANKSNFGDKLMATTALPTAVIRQYAKYGDNYLLTMKEFNKKSLALSTQSIKKIKNKFPSMPKINFKNSEDFNNKMVKALQFTGRKGWKVSQQLWKLAKANPKSTVVTSLFAWYITDPKSFFEQKEKLITFIGSTVEEGASDVTKLTFGASSGIADGFMSIAKEKMTLSNIIVFILAIFTFILWKLRSYIKRYFKIKLNNSLEKVTNKSKNTENSEGLL